MREQLFTVLHVLGQCALYIVSAVIIVLAVLSLAGFFYGLGWQIELLSSPRPAFMIVAMLAGVGFAARKYLTMAVVSAMVLLFNAIIVFPFFLPANHSGRTLGTFTVLHINTNEGGIDVETIISDGADVVLLQEVTPQFNDELTGLAGYTMVDSNPADGGEGSAILTKNDTEFPVTSTEPLVAPTGNITMLTAQVEVGERTVSLLSAHATRPTNSATNDSQLDELEMIATWSQQVRSDGRDVVVVGDLNVTPWSSRYKRMLDDGSLAESMNGYGLQNTWPTSAPGLLRLPIDNAAHSVGIDVWSRETFPVEGSNHSALRFKIVVQP